MLMELGRGPLLLDLLEVTTALEEKHFDLTWGSRGFRIQVRPITGVTSAVLRISNIKGEVGKSITDSPKPKFWTVPAGTHFEGILGIRVMAEDAPKPNADGTPVDATDGTIGEQRWYVTSETANTQIEILEIPGS